MHGCESTEIKTGFGGPDDDSFCGWNTCSEGQGDCDFDYQCSGDLVCGNNNCKDFNPAALGDSDCCVKKGGESCPYTDKISGCSDWARGGYCTTGIYKDYVMQNCEKSCKCKASDSAS